MNSLYLECPWDLWNRQFHFLWFCFWENALYIAFIFPMILNYSYLSFWLSTDYYRLQMLLSDKQINILLNHRTIVVKFACYSNIRYFYIFIKKLLTVVLKQPWRDFLLNRLSLLNFNIFFTANFGRILGSSPLWELISGLWSAALLRMSSYAGVLGSLLKCSELPILQNASGWLLPFIFTFREYFLS